MCQDSPRKGPLHALPYWWGVLFLGSGFLFSLCMIFFVFSPPSFFNPLVLCFVIFILISPRKMYVYMRWAGHEQRIPLLASSSATAAAMGRRPPNKTAAVDQPAIAIDATRGSTRIRQGGGRPVCGPNRQETNGAVSSNRNGRRLHSRISAARLTPTRQMRLVFFFL